MFNSANTLFASYTMHSTTSIHCRSLVPCKSQELLFAHKISLRTKNLSLHKKSLFTVEENIAFRLDFPMVGNCKHHITYIKRGICWFGKHILMSGHRPYIRWIYGHRLQSIIGFVLILWCAEAFMVNLNSAVAYAVSVCVCR